MSAASAAVLALNPARVAEWWLVGYESRQLNSTESDNDNIDAGDVGAGQSVTVLYELVLAGTNCLVAERCWDQVRWALEEHAWRFDGSRRRLRTRGAA